MSNNIYDILKKIESLEAPKKTNLTESKMTTVKELHNESKKEKSTHKGTIAEAVAKVEKQLSEKFQGFKKSAAPEIGSNLPKSDTETFGLEPGRAYDIETPKDWKPGDKKRDVRELIPTKDKKDHIRSRLGKHVKPAHLPEGTVEESGLMYHAGVKKHGQKYMDLAKEAGQKGASQEELGRLKDKHSKAYKNKKMDEGIMDTVKGYAKKAGRAIASEMNPRVYARNHFEDWIDSNPGLASHKEGLMSLYDRADNGINLTSNDDRGERVLQVYKQILKGQTDNLPDWATAPAPDKPRGRKLAGVIPVDEGSYNEEMLSPKQKKIASMAGDPDKIDAKDFAALRGQKKGKKTEGNYFGNQVRLAREKGLRRADLDGDGDMEPVRGGKKMGEELDPKYKTPNWDAHQARMKDPAIRSFSQQRDAASSSPGASYGAYAADERGQQAYKDRTAPGIINTIKNFVGYDKPDPAYGPKDPTPMKEGRKSMREGWEEMQKYLDKKRGPESKGGAGKKAGTRYGGSAQKDDDDEETDGEGKPVEKKRGRPKGTGGGAKFSFKKPKD